MASSRICGVERVVLMLFALGGTVASATQALKPKPAENAGAQTRAGCASAYAANFTPYALSASGYDKETPRLPKPDKGKPVVEPDFSTCVIRATAHDREPPKLFARSDYARREPFSAGNRYFFAYDYPGAWHLYDAASLAYLKALNSVGADAETQWSTDDDNLLYFVDANGGTQLKKLDVRTNMPSVAVDFAGRLPAWANKAAHIWTHSEGSPSADMRYWGFQVDDEAFQLLGYIIWDLKAQRLVGSLPANDRPDHVSMSPSGRWFTTAGDRAGTASSGTWAWSPDFRWKKKLHHTAEHSDLAIAANGHDAYVSVDYESSRGDVFFVDIDTCPAVPAEAKSAPMCPRTVLFPLYDNGAASALHFSGKAYAKPGWVLMSTYATSPTRTGRWPWYRDKIFAVELSGSPRLFALGRTRATDAGCYWAEPHAAVSRDFTRILYNSDWLDDKPCTKETASAPRDIDAYLISLPANALPQAR